MIKERKDLHEPKGVDIELYQPVDYLQVRNILLESGLFQERTDTEEAFKRKIQNDPESIIVAKKDGNVVGSAFVTTDGWVALMFHLCVTKSERGTGLGQLLIRKSAELAEKRGCKKLEITVSARNSRLIEYYTELGFEGDNDFRWMELKISN